MQNRVQSRPYPAGIVLMACLFALGPLHAQTSGGQAGARAPLSIAGSGSNIPLTQAILDAYNKKFNLSLLIPPSIGSAGAIKALQAGQIELGILSRPLKDAELAAGLRQKAYARIGIVIGVHPSVPDTSISSKELVQVFEGTKKTWKDGRPIIVLAREVGDSSNAVLEKAIPNFSQALADSFAKKRWDVFYTDADENAAIAATRDSIGLTDTVAVLEFGGGIKALRFEGVEATPRAVADGSYPLYKDLYFAYREPLTAAAAAFIEFTLSPEGRKLIAASGALPLPKD